MNKIGIIIQARMGSTRLPGKVMLDLAGKPVLWHVVERCKKANVNNVVVATTNSKKDDKIVKFCKENDYEYFRGSERDVLDRYYRCAIDFGFDIIIRITSDCPLIDYNIINELIKLFKNGNYDYCSNALERRNFPIGYDCEIVSFKILEHVWKKSTSKSEREHVTYYIRQNKNLFNTCQLDNPIGYSNYRLVLDEEEDFKVIKEMFSRLFDKNKYFGFNDVALVLKQKPEFAKINGHVIQKS